MKNYIILVLFFFYLQAFFVSKSFAQYQNYVPNSGFEIGSYSGCQGANFTSIDNWEQADPGCGRWENNRWIDLSIAGCYTAVYSEFPYGFTPSLLPSNRVLYMKTISGESCNDDDRAGVYVGLNADLLMSTDYLLRFKYLALKPAENIYGANKAKLRVFFAEWGEHWQSGDKIEMINLNLEEDPEHIQGNWKLYERSFRLESNSIDASNLIFLDDEGGFLIDDVEILKKCRDDRLIQNKYYDSYFYNISNGPFIERSSDYIKAGFDVGSYSYPTGNVVMDPGTSVIYKAESTIELFNGFEANGNFETLLIGDCNVSRIRRDSVKVYLKENKISNIEQTWIIYPNPSAGIFTISSNNIDINENYVYSLFDITGKNLIKKNIVMENTILDLDEMSNGIYFLNISNGNHNYNKKIILSH